MILSWVTFIYFISFVLYLFRLITGKEFWGRAASFLAWGGLSAQAIAMIIDGEHLTVWALDIFHWPTFMNPWSFLPGPLC